jgi:adenosylmethionine-8-amino-7-oxononanoate aminotransferase
MERGLMVYGMGGTIDGREGDHVLIAPPYIVGDEHVAELVEKLTAAVTTTFS